MTRIAVVTGSAKGLGREIAFHLTKKGYILVVHFLNSEREANSILKKVRKFSPDSIALQADLKKEDDVRKFMEKIIKKFKRIDLLVNNVGNFLFKDFSKTSNNEFKDIVESNVYSTLFTSRAVLPMMRKQEFGNIINIGAVGAERFTLRKESTPYFMAKNMVYVLTKTMAREQAGSGIRINMVSPGSMKTDIFSRKDFPMGRETKFKDVTCAIDFLLSDSAYYINGANIEVAGAFIPGWNKNTNDI